MQMCDSCVVLPSIRRFVLGTVCVLSETQWFYCQVVVLLLNDFSTLPRRPTFARSQHSMHRMCA
jgi:hypothetical protein